MKNFKKVGLVFVSILAVISLGACSAEWKTSRSEERRVGKECTAEGRCRGAGEG